MVQPKAMSDDELLVAVKNRYQASTSYRDSEVATRRKIVRDYYDGKPLGNEQADRSQAIVHEVRAKIENLLPGLMDVFFGEEDVITIQADDEIYSELIDEVGKYDQEQMNARIHEVTQMMRDATDHCNDVFLKKNDGFMVTYKAVKDALKEITGIVKVWVADEEKVSRERRKGLYPEEIDELMNQEDTEIEDVSEPRLEDVEGLAVEVRDVTVVTRTTKRAIRLGNVAPEDFGIDDDAVDVASAQYLYCAKLTTRSELVNEGYDVDLVYSLPSYQGSAGTTGSTGVSVQRRRSNLDYDAVLDPSSEEVRVVEHYIVIDTDGDGVGERRKVTVGGNAGENGTMMDNEEWDDSWPFHVLQAIIEPHEFFGVAFGELATNHQLINSTVYREWLDNLYGANNNRVKVFEDKANTVDMAAVYSKRQDTPIRIRARPGMADVVPLPHVPLGDSIMPLLEWNDRRSEIDTGVSRYSAGVSSDSLNQTAHGMERITSKSEARELLMARLLIETGVRGIFEAIYDLSRKYLDGARPLMRKGEVRVVDPGNWPEQCAINMEMGTGKGSPMERRANGMALAQLGADLAKYGYVSQQNGYNIAATAIRSMGYKSVTPYITDPSTPAGKQEQQRIQEQREKQDQTMEQLVQVEMAKVTQKQEEAMMKARGQIEELQAKLVEAQQQGELDRAQFMADMRQQQFDNQMEMRKLMSDTALQLMDMGAARVKDINEARNQDIEEATAAGLFAS